MKCKHEDDSSENSAKEKGLKKAYVIFWKSSPASPLNLIIIKEKSPWPSSIEKTDALKEITSSVNILWLRYQPIDSESYTLYAQPSMYFKWPHFLQTKVEKKALITEEVPETATSKAYFYCKLK
ncbi:hypothetical protein F4703DRAFT_1789250 [Phycomyces blakesleeanus]